MRGDTGLVDYLIARGADVNIPNIRLETPVDWIYSRQWEIPADDLELHERRSIADVPLLVDLFTTEAFRSETVLLVQPPLREERK
jgi:hypothetical protein